ncbi:MAG: preprotein translocase subunit SecG [Ruminococcaceae bacterium]|nr:preprotein translocase subunit SecG [Oscillospiraceae bacterium]
MEVLEIILTILEVIASVALVAVVLFQSGKEAGLSSALAGGNQETYMGKGKSGNLDKTLASATKWIALVWILLTLSLNLF